MENFLSPLFGGGLVIPRFGPDTTLSVLLPALPVRKPSTGTPGQAKGGNKTKPPKQFRVPGERGRMLAPVVATDAEFLNTKAMTGGGTMACITYRGRTVAGDGQETPDGLAEMAAELLAQELIREDDWCGSLGKSVRRGLSRWAHDVMGAGGIRILTNLELVYTDDGPAYDRGVRLGRWCDFFQGRRDRPVGFFGLRWRMSPRRVHVRPAVEALEAAWPGYGFSVLELLENSFVSGVQGHTFHWGHRALTSNAILLRQWEKHDQDPFGALDDPLGIGALLRKPDGLSAEDFFRLIPRGTVEHMWKLEQAQEVLADAPRAHPALAPMAEAAMEVWQACRASGKRFYTLNHAQWLSWNMTQKNLHTGREKDMPIEALHRAPTCYTVWDDADLMGRLVDDYHQFCRSNMLYTDLTWMHCFQIGHPGVESKLGAAHLRKVERLIKKVAKTDPDKISVWEKDYQPAPMPDGGLSHAVEALRIVLRIIVAVDRLLWLMESMATGKEC